jgi:predicted HTH transcriptional regulator
MAQDSKISISGLSQKIGISTTAKEKHIHQLKHKEILKRKGSAKGGQWVIVKNNR